MKYSVFLLLIWSGFKAYSQDVSTEATTIRNFSDNIGNVNSFSRTVPIVVGEEVGSSYLFDDFQEILIEMAVTYDTIVFEKANYHLELQTVVFENKGKFESVRPIFLSRFQSLANEENGSIYVNKKLLLESLDKTNSQNDRPEGFLEEVSLGDGCDLYRDWYLDITEPTYNEALNIGSKERVLKRKDNYSLVYNNVYYENFKLSNKRIKEIFSSSSSQVKSFVKENGLKGNTESELLQVVEYIRSRN